MRVTSRNATAELVNTSVLGARNGSRPATLREISPASVVTESAKVEAARQADEHKAKEERLKRALDGLNEAMHAMDRQIRFEKHDATGTMMVRIIDAETGDVLREIPPKKILDMVGQMLQGLMVDEKA